MQNSWLVPDMLRICPQSGSVLEQEADTRDILKPMRSVAIVSPRNAYVSFQVVVRVEHSGSPSCDFTAGALQHDNGEVIEREEYRFFAEWYHQIGGAYYPDALVPCESGQVFQQITERNAVPKQRFAVLWVDLFVPRSAAPGTYKGEVRIVSGGLADTHHVHLEVLGTTVPNEMTLTMDLNSYADSLSHQYDHLRGRRSRYRDGSYFAVERQYYRLAHEHRTLLHVLPYKHSGSMPESFFPELEGGGKSIRVKDWSLFDEHYAPYLDGSAFANTKRGAIPLTHMYLPFNFHWPADYAKFGMKGYRTEFTTIFRDFHDRFTKKGWLDTSFELFFNHKKRYKLFPYDGDETRFIWDEKINDIFYDMAKDVLERKDGARFVFRTDSSWSYGSHYQKYADIIKLWVVNQQIFMWYPEALPVFRAKGCSVWVYGEAQPIQVNLLGTVLTPLACAALGIDGFNYWNSVNAGEDWQHTPAGNGRTTLFYPGERLFNVSGPIPSLRLKVLRNALQLAECMVRWIREEQRTEDQEKRRAALSDCIASYLDGPDTFRWPARPAFTSKSPFEWTNEHLSEAVPTKYHEGKAPELYGRLAQAVWTMLGK